MENKNNERQLAKDLYLHTDKTQAEIAEILNVNRKTLYLWIKNGKWEEMKIAARQAPGIILQDIYNHIDEINKKVRKREEDRCPTMEEVEKLRKLLRMTTLINKKSTGTYVEVIEELTLFIAKKDIDLAHKVMKFADSYIKGTAANKNFNLEENVAEIEATLTQDDELTVSDTPTNADPDNTSLSFGEGEGMAQRGIDGVSTTSEDKVPKPVIINEVNEDIHNDADPTLPQEKNEGGGASDPSAPALDIPSAPALTPALDITPDVTPSRHDYWTQYLEERFQISADPYVTRKNGITIIRHPSPLWNRRNGLFF